MVEMSIVLVVIGLLLGGTLVGKNMIRNAAVQSVMKEKDTYSGAIRTFKDRYGAYPGDFAKAAETWGFLAASCTTSATPGTPVSLATCNGNGDGAIGGLDSRGGTVVDNIHEMFRAWQHLNSAKLVAEYYNGTYLNSLMTADVTAAQQTEIAAAASGTLKHARTAARFGLNAPKSKFSDQSGWNLSTLWGALPNTCDADYATGSARGNALVFASHIQGKSYNMGLTYDVFQLLNPEEAKAIDAKLDDGLPTSGLVRGIGVGNTALPNNTFCYSNACTASTDYATLNSSASCGLAFLNSY